MSTVGVVRFVAAPAVWLLKYLVGGLSVFGLGVSVRRVPDDEDSEDSEDSEDPQGSQDSRISEDSSASRTTPARSLDGLDGLSEDERLWAAELADGDEGAFWLT